MSSQTPGLGRAIRRALFWSTASVLVLRFYNFGLGIALARILAPSEFGTYAVALTVQNVLITVANLGLGTQLIRSDDFERDAPPVALFGLLSGGLLGGLVTALAVPIAHGMGNPESALAIALFGPTLLLSGLETVPMALLSRELRQRSQLVVSLVDYTVGGAISVTLALQGLGAAGLAIGFLIANTCTTIALFVVTRRRPKFRWDSHAMGAAARFGTPIAIGMLVSALSASAAVPVIANISNQIHVAYYTLAMNIATWPTSTVGQVVRSVALPAFARMQHHDPTEVLRYAVRVTWLLIAPAGILLGVLAHPLIVTVYGQHWASAAPSLAGLAAFSVTRVIFDVFTGFLQAHGDSRSTMTIQIAWVLVLIPALVVGTELNEIVGPALAQTIVPLVVGLPLYIVALRRLGVRTRGIVADLGPITASAIAAGAVAAGVDRVVPGEWQSFVAASAAAGVLYVALQHRALLTTVRSSRPAVAS